MYKNPFPDTLHMFPIEHEHEDNGFTPNTSLCFIIIFQVIL